MTAYDDNEPDEINCPCCDEPVGSHEEIFNCEECDTPVCNSCSAQRVLDEHEGVKE